MTRDREQLLRQSACDACEGTGRFKIVPAEDCAMCDGTGVKNARKKPEHKEVLVQKRPVTMRAIRYAEDGSNEAPVWEFIKRHGGDCRGMSGSTNNFYLYGPQGYGRRPSQTVFPGDWIVETERGGIQAIPHADLCGRYVLADGRHVAYAHA